MCFLKQVSSSNQIVHLFAELYDIYKVDIVDIEWLLDSVSTNIIQPIERYILNERNDEHPFLNLKCTRDRLNTDDSEDQEEEKDFTQRDRQNAEDLEDQEEEKEPIQRVRLKAEVSEDQEEENELTQQDRLNTEDSDDHKQEEEEAQAKGQHQSIVHESVVA